MKNACTIQALDALWVARLGRISWSGIYPGDAPLDGFVAVTAGRGLPVGVLTWFESEDASAEGSFVLAVNRSARNGDAVASALVERLPTQMLRQRNWIAEDSVESRALADIGARVSSAGCIYEIPFDSVDERVRRLGAMLDAKKPLQSGQEIRSWSPELRMEVRGIVQAEKLADVACLDAMMTPGSTVAISTPATSLALDEGRLVGIFLSHIQGDRCEVPVRWVAPSHRQSWVNARLMLRSLTEGRPHHPEVTRLRFKGDEATHRETHQLCRRFGGEQKERRLRMTVGSKTPAMAGGNLRDG